jgi:hypothetical protein
MGDGKQAAKELVVEFRARTAQAAFVNVSRQELASGLALRIDNPLLINQGSANLCGPASFVYTLDRSDPLAYTNFVIDLYERGRAEIGEFVVEPSEDLKKYQLPKNTDGTGFIVHPADWVPMASIRNSKGSVVFWDSYDDVKDAASGITMPSNLTDWLEEVGYSTVIDKTSVIGLSRDAAESRLRDAVAKLGENYKVFLLIKASLLGGDTKKKKKSGGTFPNHWVVLEFGSVTDVSVSLEVYSWGGRMKVPPAGSGWTVDDVLARYYGYVAAKY